MSDTYECADCGRQFENETALMWCCNTDEERKRGIYRSSN